VAGVRFQGVKLLTSQGAPALPRLWNNTCPMQGRHSWIALIAAFAALVAGVAAYRFSNEPASPISLISGTALGEQATPISEFELVDHSGKRLDSERLRGHWTFVFFGYTHCPDICPGTLATLDKAMDEIDSRNDEKDVQVLFISVDPARDSPQRLKEYVHYFNADFMGATGEDGEVSRFALSLGIPYAKVPSSQADGYLVDHGASILLIGPSARLEAVFSQPHDPHKLAQDFLKLRSRV
jgi:protein SCO1